MELKENKLFKRQLNTYLENCKQLITALIYEG